MLARLGGTGICLVIGLLALLVMPAVTAAQDREDPILAFVKPRVKDPDKPFTLVVRLQVKEGSGEQFAAAFGKSRRETRKEKGNLAYDLNRDADEPSHYLVYERWKSLADLESHLQTPHVKALLAELPQVIVGAPEFHVLVPAGE
jgi:quinol monooxygenase YgiN